MKSWLEQFKTEDWIIVYAGAIILALALLFPGHMPFMPKSISETQNWVSALYMFCFVYVLAIGCQLALKRPIKGMLSSLICIFIMALLAQVIAHIGFIKQLGFEAVFFSVIFGLFVRNALRVPEWLKPAIQSEFYIKIGIICLGSSILFSDVMRAGALGLVQAVLVITIVWFFTFWVAKKLNVDEKMGMIIASGLSICGVSACIATSRVIKADNKQLSYITSLVLVCVVPMMYLMPWLVSLLELSPEVAGAWIGGTIDTTGGVVSSASMISEDANNIAVVAKASQNVLLGVVAFLIAVYWAYKGDKTVEKPSAGMIWERFPKFVLGFVAASLVFSFCFDESLAREAGKVTKALSTTLFSIAFVCVGLETRFKDIFSKENRKPLTAFIAGQSFNIVITLGLAYLLFGILN